MSNPKKSPSSKSATKRAAAEASPLRLAVVVRASAVVEAPTSVVAQHAAPPLPLSASLELPTDSTAELGLPEEPSVLPATVGTRHINPLGLRMMQAYLNAYDRALALRFAPEHELTEDELLLVERIAGAAQHEAWLNEMQDGVYLSECISPMSEPEVAPPISVRRVVRHVEPEPTIKHNTA
jgi:hypothetical protein